ncbi:MAG: PLP-dependent cysteine synthase family protein [Acholeplasmataceae bacterium]|nr:PLP-dependent cysteine synthase family protein [Acholeplasmataceae bacterium]
MIPEHNVAVFEQLCQLIGSTPLSKISYHYQGEKRAIYVKHEHYNLTGSVKDRMALYILHSAYEMGVLQSTSKIVEATSGNTGISFAAIGNALGHPVKIYMPDWMSKERVNLIKSYGAEIELVSKDQGGFLGCIRLAELYAKQNADTFLPSQFSNRNNCEAHYKTTGPEILLQMKHFKVVPDAFVAGVGTGGTIMGVGKYLKEMNPNIKIYPLEPENSPTLCTGYKVGKHRIEGISDEFIPELIHLDELDDVIDVDDGDAILMAQKLACRLGMGVGISSGANFLGAVKIQNMLGKDSIITTVFPDDNKKYLSTDLMGEEPEKSGFLSPDIDQMRIESVITIKELDIQNKIYRICVDDEPNPTE